MFIIRFEFLTPIPLKFKYDKYSNILCFQYLQKMVSRRKILSRSRDDLNAEQPYVPEDEEDVWYQKDKLFKVSMSIVN